eukprot:362168-Chlamydomonas_euryale.AAC.2
MQHPRHPTPFLSFLPAAACNTYAHATPPPPDPLPFLPPRSEAAAAAVPALPQVPPPQPGDSAERRAALSLAAEDLAVLAEGPRAHGAVAAATLDVYGEQLASLALLTTREDVRGQGHARWVWTEGVARQSGCVRGQVCGRIGVWGVWEACSSKQTRRMCGSRGAVGGGTGERVAREPGEAGGERRGVVSMSRAVWSVGVRFLRGLTQ